MSAYIDPEYIVTFKLEPNVQGNHYVIVAGKYDQAVVITKSVQFLTDFAIPILFSEYLSGLGDIRYHVVTTPPFDLPTLSPARLP